MNNIMFMTNLWVQAGPPADERRLLLDARALQNGSGSPDFGDGAKLDRRPQEAAGQAAVWRGPGGHLRIEQNSRVQPQTG